MKSYFLDTANLRVYVRENGVGRPVLFLHGYPFTGHFWRHQLSGLGDRFRCIAVDTRGYGLTEWNGGRITRDILARDVVDVLDALHIAKADVVGHDWGLIIAAAAAFRYPERIERLALLDAPVTVWLPHGPHAWWFKDEQRAEAFFAEHGADYIRAQMTGSSVRYGSAPDSPWWTAGPKPYYTDEDVNHYVSSFLDREAWRASIEYYRHGLPFHEITPDPRARLGLTFRHVTSLEVARHWNDPDSPMGAHKNWWPVIAPEDLHVRVSMPTLLMYTRGLFPGPFQAATTGELPPDDAHLGDDPVARSFRDHFPDLTTRGFASGHNFPEEEPGRTNDLLRQFLIGPGDAPHHSRSADPEITRW